MAEGSVSKNFDDFIKLPERIKNLIGNKKFFDVTLKVGKTEIITHKFLLAGNFSSSHSAT
jgi:hypothetical protein